MRPLPHRLVLANYPSRIEVQTRFRDLDPLNHLNNVAIGNFYEEGRSAFNRAVLGTPRKWRGLRFMMVHVSISYLQQGRYPTPCVVGTGIVRVGRSAYTLGHGLFQDGVCIGAADSTIANTADGKSAPLPDDLCEALLALSIAEAESAEA